jgi:putative hydrolase of the HAD superfamily
MRAFLFDLDDTLFDHRHSTRAALAEIQRRVPALASLSLDALDERHAIVLEELHAQVLSGALTVDAARIERLRRLVESQRVSIEASVIEAAAAAYRAAYLRERRAVPGARDLLRVLRPHGAIGVISNNLVAEQQGKMDVCRLREHVDALVVSEEAGAAKPDPAIFVEALRRLGAAPGEAVMIGDSWSADILGARAAGIRAVWFNPHGRPCPEPGVVPELGGWVPVEEVLGVVLDDR